MCIAHPVADRPQALNNWRATAEDAPEGIFGRFVRRDAERLGGQPVESRQFIAVNGPGYAESLRAWEHGWTRYYERPRIPPELRNSIDQSVLGAEDTALAYARGADRPSATARHSRSRLLANGQMRPLRNV
jgi:hypothetical protein